ncbi:MAG: hypothetical protein K2M90_04520 [Treponemataceae bacterium]|nr:hypothetical protein [Treponemataceae bacterium]MDE7391715.1 hypothetical protein [Treponemataceae bacterium]
MMKKLSKLATLLFATTFLFGSAFAFVSCSDDDDGGTGETSETPTTPNTPETPETPENTAVDAVWTFAGVTFGEGTMAGLTTGSKLQSDVELTATSGTGATLTALSQSTFKEDGDSKRGLKTDASKKFDDIANVTFGVKGIGSSDATKGAIKGALKLVLSADATVVLKGLVSGSADTRYLLLAGADEQILKIVPETAGDAAEQTIEQELAAGTYYIGLDGFILASVECK